MSGYHPASPLTSSDAPGKYQISLNFSSDPYRLGFMTILLKREGFCFKKKKFEKHYVKESINILAINK